MTNAIVNRHPQWSKPTYTTSFRRPYPISSALSNVQRSHNYSIIIRYPFSKDNPSLLRLFDSFGSRPSTEHVLCITQWTFYWRRKTRGLPRDVALKDTFLFKFQDTRQGARQDDKEATRMLFLLLQNTNLCLLQDLSTIARRPPFQTKWCCS